LGPRSLGLLEEDFQRMRATSPNPNNFQHGRWNPQYQKIYPNRYGQYYPNPYPPYYGGGYYGGGYYPYPYYGNPYFPTGGIYGGMLGSGIGGYFGYNLQPQTVEREVVIIREPRTDVPAPNRPERTPDDFYLKNPNAETIATALDDIRKAWLNGDVERLRARFKSDGRVRVYPRGEYKYSVEGKDFMAMLADAMKTIDTIAFEFDAPRPEEGGRVFVTGKHTFTDGEKKRQTTYISYVLERSGNRWVITEAGSANSPFNRHTDQ
jgi:hypothetical protein